jgi:hypothetical protein
MHYTVMNKSNSRVSLAAGLMAAVFAIVTPAPGGTSDGHGEVARVTVLTENGGHVAWHPKEDLIAFDRLDNVP